MEANGTDGRFYHYEYEGDDDNYKQTAINQSIALQFAFHELQRMYRGEKTAMHWDLVFDAQFEDWVKEIKDKALELGVYTNDVDMETVAILDFWESAVEEIKQLFNEKDDEDL